MKYKTLTADEVQDQHYGTCYQGEIEPAAFAEVKAVLGEPTSDKTSGDDKVTSEWTVLDEEGNVYTVYDYKATREYSCRRSDPTVKQFRRMLYAWHIGAKYENQAGAKTFYKWLNRKIAANRK